MGVLDLREDSLSLEPVQGLIRPTFQYHGRKNTIQGKENTVSNNLGLLELEFYPSWLIFYCTGKHHILSLFNIQSFERLPIYGFLFCIFVKGGMKSQHKISLQSVFLSSH